MFAIYDFQGIQKYIYDETVYSETLYTEKTNLQFIRAAMND